MIKGKLAGNLRNLPEPRSSIHSMLFKSNETQPVSPQRQLFEFNKLIQNNGTPEEEQVCSTCSIQ